jgi:hypothetical protein
MLKKAASGVLVSLRELMRFFRKSEALEALATIDHSDYSLCSLEASTGGGRVTFPFTLTERLAKAALYCAHRAIIVHLI